MKKNYILTTILFITSIMLNAQVVDVINPVNGGPSGFLLVGSDLYISQESDNKISKINLFTTPPSITDLVGTGLDAPVGLALNGNNLYFAQASSNKISKIDITNVAAGVTDIVVSGLDEPVGLALNGDYLYISETDGNKISKININAAFPTTATDVITNIENAEGLFSDESDLYFTAKDAVSGSLKIAKASFETLSIANNLIANEISIYPNPTSDYILVSEFNTNEEYAIYTILGNEVLNTTIPQNNKIDVRNLVNGIYFLKINNSIPIKFIKN